MELLSTTWPEFQLLPCQRARLERRLFTPCNLQAKVKRNRQAPHVSTVVPCSTCITGRLVHVLGNAVVDGLRGRRGVSGPDVDIVIPPGKPGGIVSGISAGGETFPSGRSGRIGAKGEAGTKKCRQSGDNKQFHSPTFAPFAGTASDICPRSRNQATTNLSAPNFNKNGAVERIPCGGKLFSKNAAFRRYDERPRRIRVCPMLRHAADGALRSHVATGRNFIRQLRRSIRSPGRRGRGGGGLMMVLLGRRPGSRAGRGGGRGGVAITAGGGEDESKNHQKRQSAK
jgi:hypothetical protein